MSVYQKLQAARVKLQNAALKKTGHNKFAGYTYFELGDFLPVVNQIFHELGLCSVISYAADVATMRIVDVEGGQEITLTSPMAEANLKGCHPIQNLGAVETYTRRYLYVTALEIVEHDALDATTGKDAPKSAKTVAQDTHDNQSHDVQNRLRDLHILVMDGFENSDEAGMAAYTAAKEKLDTDEQVAFWALFDSKTRAYIKKLGAKAQAGNAEPLQP